MIKVFFKRLGEAILALGSLVLSVFFWLCIAAAVLVGTVCIRFIRLIKSESKERGDHEDL